jgi:hypothetical protein
MLALATLVRRRARPAATGQVFRDGQWFEYCFFDHDDCSDERVFGRWFCADCIILEKQNDNILRHGDLFAVGASKIGDPGNLRLPRAGEDEGPRASGNFCKFDAPSVFIR